MKSRFINEPLVAFVAIGGLLFLLYGFAPGDDVDTIEVSQAFLESLVEEREMVLDRPLTKDERLAIRNDFIDQEVLVREAMARRLYLNDGRLRHRLADKMFYLLAEAAVDPAPGDLDAFYEEHRRRYQTPELISFEHRFFSDEASARAAAIKGKTAADGETFYLGDRLVDYSADECAAVFGVAFTRTIGELPMGEWIGPLESGRGWHVVRVTNRTPPTDIPRETIEDRILADWHAAKLAAARRARLDALREHYKVIDLAADGDG